MYKKAKEKGVRIDRADLVAQGKRVELYPGVEEWFDAIGEYLKLRMPLPTDLVELEKALEAEFTAEMPKK